MITTLPASAVPIKPPTLRKLNGPLGCLWLLWYGEPGRASPYTPSLEHDEHGALYLVTVAGQSGDYDLLRCVYVPVTHDEARAIAAGWLAPRHVLADRMAIVVDRRVNRSDTRAPLVVDGAWTCPAEPLFHEAPAAGVTLSQGPWTAVQVATLDELLCDLGGHAPIGSGQCRCGWRGDEER